MKLFLSVKQKIYTIILISCLLIGTILSYFNTNHDNQEDQSHLWDYSDFKSCFNDKNEYIGYPNQLLLFLYDRAVSNHVGIYANHALSRSWKLILLDLEREEIATKDLNFYKNIILTYIKTVHSREIPRCIELEEILSSTPLHLLMDPIYASCEDLYKEFATMNSRNFYADLIHQLNSKYQVTIQKLDDRDNRHTPYGSVEGYFTGDGLSAFPINHFNSYSPKITKYLYNGIIQILIDNKSFLERRKYWSDSLYKYNVSKHNELVYCLLKCPEIEQFHGKSFISNLLIK